MRVAKRESQGKGGGVKREVATNGWGCHSFFHLRLPLLFCHLSFDTPILSLPPSLCDPHPFLATLPLRPPPYPCDPCFATPTFSCDHIFDTINSTFFCYGKQQRTTAIQSMEGRRVGVAEVGVADVEVADVGSQRWDRRGGVAEVKSTT